jgi:hypothetical protein
MDFKAAGLNAGTASKNASRDAAWAGRLSTPLPAGTSAFPHRGELGIAVKNTTVSVC